MKERELIIAELWSRLDSVEEMAHTARNPISPPSVSDLPAAQFFELGDLVEQMTMRGTLPVYKRRLTVVIEVFIRGSLESAAGKELSIFVRKVKQKLYEGGATLGGLCNLAEVESGRILRPPVGENTIGVGIAFEIRYLEDISKL